MLKLRTILSNQKLQRFLSTGRGYLEVERKFWYDFDIDKRLIDLGAKRTDATNNRLIDEYYDNLDSYFLLFNDYLLRCRQKGGQKSVWQLKYPSDAEKNSTLENYMELTDSSEIIRSICALSKKTPKNLETIDSLNNAFGLKPFVTINSTRRSYLIDGLKVDLDETDFGYKLGEIEVILDQSANSDLKQSLGKISSLTSRLGITSFQGIPGKVSTYLYLFNRPLLQKLLEKSIVSRNVMENLRNKFN